MIKKVVSIILCIFWMWFIFNNSSKDGTTSNEFSNKVLNKIITEFKGGATDNSINFMPSVIDSNKIYNDTNGQTIKVDDFVNQLELNQPSIFIRKNAHAFEFLVLAILIAAVFKSFGVNIKKMTIYVLFVVLFYAVSDEFHQMFIPGRNSNVVDIVIDFIGGIVGMVMFAIYYALLNYFKKLNKTKTKTKSNK